MLRYRRKNPLWRVYTALNASVMGVTVVKMRQRRTHPVGTVRANEYSVRS